MKVIKYNLCTLVNNGDDDAPDIVEVLSPVTIDWNEINETIAKQESHKGEYVIEDDGRPEPEIQIPPEERIAELESMLNALLGVTE